MLHNDRNYITEGIVRSSSAADLEAMKRVFLGYQYDRSPKYFTDPEWEQVSEEKVSFSAEGPFGVCSLDDIDVFRRMAAAAPEAYMEAAAGNKYPYDSYSCIKERLRCRLENGVLATEITTITRDSDDYRYEDFIAEILPYRKYTEIFGIEPGSLAEEDYPALINCLTGRCWESPLDLTFEEFSEILSLFGGRTALDWETYDTACEKAKVAGLITLAEFMDRISTTETAVFRFDARSRQDLL